MIQSEQLTELFAAFGVKGTSAEAVANRLRMKRGAISQARRRWESIWPTS